MSTQQKLRLVKTCGACPEQYDAYLGDECIGYLRLRHGCFTADYKDSQVYSASPDGDGQFEDGERVRYLDAACEAILKAHAESQGQTSGRFFEIDPVEQE